MKKQSPGAFTLIEMLVVMAVIAILAGLILGAARVTQYKAAASRASGEISGYTTALEAYKADNGTYPRDVAGVTDLLDPRMSGLSTAYTGASLELYKALSGDTNANFAFDNGELAKPYYEFKPIHLKGTLTNGKITAVLYIQDPWGNCYGYSTAAAKEEEQYRIDLLTTPSKVRTSTKGYNATYDIWSTGGSTSNAPAVAPLTGFKDGPKWIKNW